MKIDWSRVLRTLIQSAVGSGVALVTTISQNYTKESIIQAVITFVSTVVLAVLMNLKKQTEE